MMIRLRTLGLILFSLILVNACGFQPRGSYLLDPKLEQIYISSNDEFSPLVREVRRRLELNRIKVVTTPSDDIPALHLGNEKIERRTLSLFSNGQVAEYELSYSVSGHLLIADQDSFPINAQLHRDFQDNPLAALAKEQEKQLLYTELRAMAADQIMRQLATIKL